MTGWEARKWFRTLNEFSRKEDGTKMTMSYFKVPFLYASTLSTHIGGKEETTGWRFFKNGVFFSHERHVKGKHNAPHYLVCGKAKDEQPEAVEKKKVVELVVK